MKKILVAALIVPAMALAQTYPSPTFNSLTLQNPLTVVNGGTGASSSTGSGSVVLSTSPTLTTPNLGTPSSITLTNGAGLPISTGVSGLGTGVATALGNAVTGSGSPVLATSPTLTTPNLGAPSAVVLTNATGLPAGGIASIPSENLLANPTGSSASPQATTATSFFDNAYCNTVGYLIVRFTGSWSCAKGIAANPVWWGMTTTDATGTTNLAALNAALSASSIVTIPPGHYTLNGQVSYTLPSGAASLMLTGEGQDNTTLYWPAGGGILVTYNNIMSSAHIRDMSLTTGASATGSAIELLYATSNSDPADTALSDVSDVTIRGDAGYPASTYWGNGIFVSNVSNVNFNRIAIEGGSSRAGNGINVTGLAASSTYGVAYNVSNSYFDFLANGFVYGSYVQGVTFSQDNFTGDNAGILANGTGTTAQLSVFGSQFNCFNDNIITTVNMNGALVLGNYFIIQPSAFGVVGSFAQSSFAGNSFAAASPSSNTAINFSSGTNGAAVVSNYFANLANGVVVASGATHVNVQSNVYLGNTSNTSNSGGVTNTIGGGSP